MFEGKTVIEKYEDEFKTERMRNKHIFYDLNVRTGDPEEIRAYSAELFKDLDYKTVLNEMTKFEDAEFEGIFRGGRLKPLKSIMKGVKEFNKGVKYPIIWKLFFVLSAFSILLTFAKSWVETVPLLQAWSNYGWYAAAVMLIAAFIAYQIKERIGLALWVKMAGIYDVESSKADLRVIIAGDSEEKDKEAFMKLEDDVSEFYNVVARKYVKRKEGEAAVIERKPQETKIFENIKDVNDDISKLEKKFIDGKITEDTYKNLKSDLERKKEKFEILLDVISLK